MTDIKSIVNDEIALEGLEGITISSLWIRLKNVEFPLNLDQKSKAYIWKNVILKFASGNFDFYCLPEERPTFIDYNRYDHISSETGYFINNESEIPNDIYGDICPVNCENGIRGSCKDFDRRTAISLDDLNELSLEQVDKKYGNKLVIVANQRLRNFALRISFNDPQLELSPVQYCIVERCGRTRKYGDVTFGKESANFKEPPKTMFYFRKLLLKKGLITKQNYTVYNPKTQTINHGLILMLPRFHVDHKLPIEIAAMKIIEILKTQPNQKCEYVELRNKSRIKCKPFRHIFSVFVKNFRVTEESITASKSSKKMRYVQLIKNLDFDDDSSSSSSDEELNEDDDKTEVSSSISNESNVKLFKPGNILINRSILAQSYNIVKSYSDLNGISLREFQSELKVPRLDARMIIRNLERLNEIVSITTHTGKQKITRYFLKHRTNTTVTVYQNEINQLDLGSKTTLITLKRANLILNAVKEHKIIDQLFFFRKIIQDNEKNLPYKIDQKSIKRILDRLVKEGHLNWFKRTIGGHDKKYNLICLPSIKEDDEIVKERIEQAEFKYQSMNNNVCSINDDWSLLSNSKGDETELVYQPSVGRQYGLEPKMKKIITFYKFIFFTLSNECKKENDFELDDWRKHITPLPKYYEKDTCLLGDLIPRIPLSIFVKVVFITYVIPGLDEILNDPIRRHHTLQMLPSDIIRNLFRRRKYVFCMAELLTLLTYLNLVQLDSKTLSVKEHVSIKLLKKTQFTEDGYVKNYRLDDLNDVELLANDMALHGSRTNCTKCPFDSRLFIHNTRNWSYQPKIQRTETKAVQRFTRLRNLVGEEDPMANLDGLDLQTVNSISFGRSAKRKSNNRKSRSKRRKLLNELDKDNNNQTINESDELNPDSVKTKSTKRRKRTGYDQEDMNALSLLRKQRCEWSKEEDSFLLMCRVASILLNPNSTNFVCVSKNIIRDELYKYLPNLSLDKTSKACQRRLLYMLKNPVTKAHVLDWVAEVRQDFDSISIERPNVPITHTDEWTKAFVELLNQLLKKFQNEHFISPLNRIDNFKSLDQIYKEYNLIENEIHCVPQKPILYYQPNNTVDIYVNVVLNVLASSLLTNLFENSEEYNTRATLTLFKIYSKYPDTMIRAVVNKMKLNGMMSRLHNASKFKIRNKDKRLSLFKISQHYCYVLKSRYSMDSLIVPIDLNEEVKIRNYFEASEIALLTNLITMNRGIFNIQVPENFIDFKEQQTKSTDENIDESSNNDSTKNQSTTTTTTTNKPIGKETPYQSKRASRYLLCSLRQSMNSQTKDKCLSLQDYVVLNTCNINCRMSSNHNLINLDPFFELLNKQTMFVDLENSCLNEVQFNNLERSILKEVVKTKELGLNYKQLFEAFKSKNVDENELKSAVQNLIDLQAIFEVGVEEFRLVTHKYVVPWLVHAQLPILREDYTSTSEQTENNNSELLNGEIDIPTINDNQVDSTLMQSDQIDSSLNKDVQIDSSLNNDDQIHSSLNKDDQIDSSLNNDDQIDSSLNNDDQIDCSLNNDDDTQTNLLTSENIENDVTENENIKFKSLFKPKMIYYLPKFWKNPFGELDKRVMFLFLSGILGHIMANPGIIEEDLISFFKFCLPPVQTIEVVNLLVASNCIAKKEQIVECNHTLFGDFDTKKIVFYEPTKEAFITICALKHVFI